MTLIVHDVFKRLTRFGKLQKSLGLAENVLAARLRNLAEHGVMVAIPTENGSHQEYCLADKGRASFPLLVAIWWWGEDYLFASDELHIRLVKCDSGQPMPHLQVRAGDGGPFVARSIRVSRD